MFSVLLKTHKHNHAFDQNTVQAVKSKIEIKQIAKVSGSTPGNIFNKILKLVLMKIRTFRKVNKTNYRNAIESGNNPTEQTDIKDLVIE